MILTTASPAQTAAVGAALGRLAEPGDVIALAGDLGAGKTTLTRALAESLDVRTPVTSPTFTLVHEYEGRLPVVHIDAYRLKTLREVHDLGFDDYLDGHAVVVIEWADLLRPLLPPDRLDIRLHYAGGAGADAVRPDRRTIELTPLGTSWTARTAGLESVLTDGGSFP